MKSRDENIPLNMIKHKLLIIISAILIATIAPVSTFSLQTNEIDSVCSTDSCIEAAASALDRMDQSVNPCDDFYSFACGNFAKNTKIPDHKSKVDIFSAINDKVREQLRTCISENIKPNDPTPFKAAKKIYNICMDDSATQKNGKEPLLRILNRLGGWPVIKGDHWNGDGNWSWTETIGKFRKIGFGTNFLVSTVVSNDLKNSSLKKIHVSSCKLMQHF